MLRRAHWLEHIARLDPEVDYEEIYRVTVTHEFPWDMNQALSFAFLRTYAVRSIGRLLDETGAFQRNTQKRYDDTATCSRRSWWSRSGGWTTTAGARSPRPRSAPAPATTSSSVGSWGSRTSPTTYDAFERLLDDHEAEHFAFDPPSRRVGDATFALMKTFYPRAVAWPVDVFSRALMDEPVRFEVERLGTFPRGCPVRHGNETAPSSGNDEGRPDRSSGGAPLAS
ncbi:MAG: hypothetical protein ACXWDI_08595 [Nocardioides sp.]